MNHRQFQERLLRDFGKTSFRPSSKSVIDGFLNCPRHCFVHQYRFCDEESWSTFAPDEYHLDRVYRDEPLVIVGNGEFTYKSSNSQPSYILALLDALSVESGHRVLEIGSGSGWLAGIIGRIIGLEGRVTGIEVLSDLASQSRRDIEALGLGNVEIIAGDGRLGWKAGAPFDRAIFTAGLYAIPPALFEQIAPGGQLIAPIRMLGHGDVIAVLERTETGFRSTQTFDGYFVPVADEPTRVDIVEISDDPRWRSFSSNISFLRSMWWGQSNPDRDFIQKSAGFRSFMTIALPEARAFRIAAAGKEAKREEFAFGLVDLNLGSAGLITKDRIMGYGRRDTLDRVLGCLDQWIDLGMPCGANFRVEIERSRTAEKPSGKNAWIESRGDQMFLWELQS